MNVYVASSWRNDYQQQVVQRLRDQGHDVYDFKNPPSRTGFSWSDVDPDWKKWTNVQYLQGLNHPISQAGFKSDFDAMKWADACVLVMPCGRSAHVEAGWMQGAGKPTFILLDEHTTAEPELMYKMFNAVCLSIDAVLIHLDICMEWR
ncbi:MAG: hypothetical protein ACO1NU_08620 [Arcticibacter sp.]